MIVDVDADKNCDVVRHLFNSLLCPSQKHLLVLEKFVLGRLHKLTFHFQFFYALLIMFEVWLSFLLMIHIY